MDKILYLECEAGISGDMSVAALLDLGADEEQLREALARVPLSGYEIRISRVKKSSIDCLDFDVILSEEIDNHDHDMDYLYGHCNEAEVPYHQGHHHEAEAPYHQRHHHEAEESCHHGHSHEGSGKDSLEHVHTHHVHRGLKDVYEIIEGSQLSERAERLAKDIFLILGRAEAKAHGHSLEEVHFHEVGAVDSIIDIIAVSVCMDSLGIEKVCIKSLSEGQGTIRCAHGILSVPVPATLNIVTEYGIPLKSTGVKGELVTPTGAAFAAAVRNMDRLPEEYVIEKVGLGAGKRDYKTSGILRAMIIRAV